MAIFQILTKKTEPKKQMSSDACKQYSFIQQRRLQILVHSYLYYQLNTNIVDDATFDQYLNYVEKECGVKFNELLG